MVGAAKGGDLVVNSKLRAKTEASKWVFLCSGDMTAGLA